MKILLMSDSHKQFVFLQKMVEKEKPDLVFAMGDYSSDFEELSYLYPEIPFTIVKGNCDFWDRRNPEEEILELEGKKFLITHGHLYGVKSSYLSLRERATTLGCDVAVFGHTHKEYWEEGKLCLCNPGAAEDQKYGIIRITKGKIQAELKKL